VIIYFVNKITDKAPVGISRNL